MTIGSDLVNSGNSGSLNSMTTHIQTALQADHLAGGGLVAPLSGVVVRWRANTGSQVTGTRLRVLRPGGDPGGSKLGAGTGTTRLPTAFTLNEFPESLPIQAGDGIGLDIVGAGSLSLISATGVTAASIRDAWFSLLADGGAPSAPDSSAAGAELTFNADIEPDCDGDGLGDESQDGDISSCGPSPPPSPIALPAAVPSNDFGVGKVQRNAKKGIAFLLVDVPGPGMVGLDGPGLNELGLASTAARKSLAVAGGVVKLKIAPAKKGKRARKIRQALVNKGKAKVKAEVTYMPNGGTANTQATKLKLIKRR